VVDENCDEDEEEEDVEEEEEEEDSSVASNSDCSTLALSSSFSSSLCMPLLVFVRKGAIAFEEEDDEDPADFAMARLDLILTRRFASSAPSSKSSEIKKRDEGYAEE
jgi:hypothetical protein